MRLCLLFLTLLWAACAGQRLSDFRTPMPVPPGETLVIGIHGGWIEFDDHRKAVGKLVADLRQEQLPGVHVEAVENHKLKLAEVLIRRAFDRNQDGRLTREEAAKGRLILFGQSLGGGKLPRLARACERMGVDVELAVLIDAVGVNKVIPGNVHAVANFYQRDPLTIIGEDEVKVAAPERTRILANERHTYLFREIAMPHETWWRKRTGGGHLKMEYDPVVWGKVKGLIVGAVGVEQPGQSRIRVD